MSEISSILDTPSEQFRDNLFYVGKRYGTAAPPAEGEREDREFANFNDALDAATAWASNPANEAATIWVRPGFHVAEKRDNVTTGALTIHLEAGATLAAAMPDRVFDARSLLIWDFSNSENPTRAKVTGQGTLIHYVDIIAPNPDFFVYDPIYVPGRLLGPMFAVTNNDGTTFDRGDTIIDVDQIISGSGASDNPAPFIADLSGNNTQPTPDIHIRAKNVFMNIFFDGSAFFTSLSADNCPDVYLTADGINTSATSVSAIKPSLINTATNNPRFYLSAKQCMAVESLSTNELIGDPDVTTMVFVEPFNMNGTIARGLGVTSVRGNITRRAESFAINDSEINTIEGEGSVIFSGYETFPFNSYTNVVRDGPSELTSRFFLDIFPFTNTVDCGVFYSRQRIHRFIVSLESGSGTLTPAQNFSIGTDTLGPLTGPVSTDDLNTEGLLVIDITGPFHPVPPQNDTLRLFNSGNAISGGVIKVVTETVR